MCTLLLSHGADPTLGNCHGKTALDTAASRELRDKILRTFTCECSCSHLCGLDEYNGYSLLDAARQADLSRVKKFLASETVNFRHFKTGDSPLVGLNNRRKTILKNYLSRLQHAVCTASSAKHRRQIVETLIRRGATVNAPNTP